MALTDAKIRAAKPDVKSYKLTDGAGLHLLVHTNGSKYWRLRYRHLGKEKTLALGLYPGVSLSEARLKRDEARKLIADGIDRANKNVWLKQLLMLISLLKPSQDNGMPAIKNGLNHTVKRF
ncbi:Putative prophage CPS-53 integrase [Providencia rettgeri]|uniref:Prophage CPS-53 integrase n=1 Tax=Providencia rettgeri TaxID=587 RepID=A0A379FW30_PRORE|nr:Putative prophage CPS-53 integrase [Providencia rettgeri]